ncbi:HAD family hydrolase, partial [Streptomyces sp. SID4931]
VRGDALVLEGAGDALDGLRALCAAAWASAGAGVCGLDAGKALAGLQL